MDEQQSNPSQERRDERGSPSLPKPGTPPSFLGKHRMAAAISYLNSQINIIQGEVDQLETMAESSLVCKELAQTVESVPDPLLPVTKGPTDVTWDKWFKGASGGRNHKRWI
ncbi:guanine nucleotide-binding protein subunit gamma 2-like [Tripterygium wilfordii]|uniref:guanine nucleotide-binding protein subunit gamma 2-like n=1 Tax=Tripterygium wilfordii TaxID=458696 RepID=UPI0018F7FFF7|nr:guanine nucleotide-binding protein subunit gamma 2-like [Tripterygium wilfordii]